MVQMLLVGEEEVSSGMLVLKLEICEKEFLKRLLNGPKELEDMPLSHECTNVEVDRSNIQFGRTESGSRGGGPAPPQTA
jgi:hypothetical protein